MEQNIFQLQYAMDTFYFRFFVALFMCRAAGFSSLGAVLLGAKNTTKF